MRKVNGTPGTFFRAFGEIGNFELQTLVGGERESERPNERYWRDPHAKLYL